MTPSPSDDQRQHAPDWRPTWHPSALQTRSIAFQTIRDFFHGRGYCEVTTPVMSRDVVVDAHLHPFTVTDPATGDTLYLQTSPEAAMKRLLASGSGSIFQIGPVFRSAERGTRHNPEFTMVEWYGINTDHLDQMQLTEDLVKCLQKQLTEHCELNQPKQWQLVAPLTQPFKKTTYESAFGILTDDSVLDMPTAALRRLTQQLCKIDLHENTERDELLNLLLAQHIEPKLGDGLPEFLINYPISQAALAVASKDDPRTASRFELYINGIELCNGYFELTDSEELARRSAIENKRRQAHKTDQLPGAPRLLAAMQYGLPECSGVALGFERLLMALLNAPNIESLLPFPIEIA